jgi:hypothetical protein
MPGQPLDLRNLLPPAEVLDESARVIGAAGDLAQRAGPGQHRIDRGSRRRDLVRGENLLYAHYAVPDKGRRGVFIRKHRLLHGRTLAAGWFVRLIRIAWQPAGRSGKKRLNAAHDGSSTLGDGAFGGGGPAQAGNLRQADPGGGDLGDEDADVRWIPGRVQLSGLLRSVDLLDLSRYGLSVGVRRVLPGTAAVQLQVSPADKPETVGMAGEVVEQACCVTGQVGRVQGDGVADLRQHLRRDEAVELVLAAEVGVHAFLASACGPGDPVDPGARDPVLGKLGPQ